MRASNAAALCLSSQERVEALRFVLPEQLRRDELEHPVARAERGVLRVGAIDLPIVAPTMLRALGHVARADGLSVRQTGHSWFEQAGLLEDDRLDVAIAYRFAGVDVPEHFGEYLVATDFSGAITTTSEWSAARREPLFVVRVSVRVKASKGSSSCPPRAAMMIMAAGTLAARAGRTAVTACIGASCPILPPA